MVGGDTVRVLERVVDGRTVQVRLDRNDLKLDDLMTAVGKPASIIGLIAELLSDYTRRYREADAEYRAWQATEGERILADPANEKMAEWKLKQAVTAMPKFLAHKRRLAVLEGDMEYLRAYQQAAETMSYMVSAKKDMMRDGLVTSRYVEGSEPPRESEPLEVSEALRRAEQGAPPPRSSGGSVDDRASRREALKCKLKGATTPTGKEPEDDLPY